MMSPSPQIREHGALEGQVVTWKRPKFGQLKHVRGLAQASMVLAALSCSRALLAQVQPVIELHWDSPPQCPSADNVQQRIRDIAGDVVVAPERLRANGQIAREGEKYRLVLVITSGSASGTRVLESESCDHLSGAAAVALGILVRIANNAEAALTPDVLGEPATDQAQNQPSPAANAAPPGTVQTSPLRQARPDSDTQGNTSSRSAIDVHVRFPSMHAALGIAPGVTLGYGFAIGAGYSGWELSLAGSYWMTRDVQSEWPGYGAQLRQYSGELDFCRMWRLGVFEGGPCIRAELARVSAVGAGGSMALKNASMAAFSAGAALAGRFHLSRRVALFIDGGPQVLLTRPRLINPAFGRIYEYPLFSAKIGLGAEWIF